MPTLYLKRYGYPKVLTTDKPNPHLKISVVIPCYNEPALLDTLKSLTLCLPSTCAVEVLVLINGPEKCEEAIKATNFNTYQAASKWAEDHSTEHLKFLIFYLDDLPNKHAGVGLARKIGMDTAVRRFQRLENLDPHEAIIVCLDADSLCSPSYLQSIENHFLQYPQSPGCAIYYEHPLEGDLSPIVYQGIIKYELYLRYYVHALRYAGFPYAFQTIGSSMAVRLPAYVKQGGMNKKKAGEDFYFLHKIIPLGNFSALTTTTVIPSSRISDRVPFGTGRAIGDWAKSTRPFYPAYAPQTFEVLREWLDHISELFALPEDNYQQWITERPTAVQDFLQTHDFIKEIKRIKRESSTIKGFYKKFFEWFNAFGALKFVHFCRDKYYKDIPVEEAAKWVLGQHHKIETTYSTDKDLLLYFRNLDKNEDAFYLNVFTNNQ